ncbi:MAG: 4-phosphopantetheinyl transferase [Solirubrobacteraceae bacterium]|jgi:4'-phosphopantetheinyl transferase|nr:4-phosphopantetheinyl transferase [Solirubrobacteraceae bacterium]
MAPPQPSLADGAVHVWRADLAKVDDGLTGLLSAGELTRAEGFPRARDGKLWARGRGVLRALLGRYLQRDPRTLRFAASAHGKPELLDDRRDTATSFNVSHSGELAVYAFTTIGPVGVDIEVARRPIDAVALAERAFGPEAAEGLERLEPDRRQREFLRAWVRHEAALKLAGRGIGAADARARSTPEATWIAELEFTGCAAAAVALDAAPAQLRCREWL